MIGEWVDGCWLMVDGRDASAGNQLSTFNHQPVRVLNGRGQV